MMRLASASGLHAERGFRSKYEEGKTSHAIVHNVPQQYHHFATQSPKLRKSFVGGGEPESTSSIKPA
jgi:hypothetical protein